MSSSWSDLPGDVLFLIAKKVISCYDFVSFSQVCSPWRSIAKQDRKRFRPVIPGTLTKQGFMLEINPFISSRFFQSLPTLPLPIETVVCAHQGWIVVMKDSPHNQLTLINPVTQVQRKLPFSSASRIIFSANPMDCNCYCIIADPPDPLRCCKSGDAGWTVVESSDLLREPDASFGFVDAICYRGKLYAVRKTGELFVCEDINASPPMMTKLANCPGYSRRTSARFFLVEAGQELLMAYLKGEHLSFEGLKVYRLAVGGLRWDRVTNLGEHALFLGKSQSFSLSELDVRGIKGNHIYYIEESKKSSCENSSCENSSCVFDDDGVIKYFRFEGLNEVSTKGEEDGSSEGEDESSECEEDSGNEICVFSLEKSSAELLPLEKSLGFWFMPQFF